jgi:hypothetical protein
MLGLLFSLTIFKLSFLITFSSLGGVILFSRIFAFILLSCLIEEKNNHTILKDKTKTHKANTFLFLNIFFLCFFSIHSLNFSKFVFSCFTSFIISCSFSCSFLIITSSFFSSFTSFLIFVSSFLESSFAYEPL